MVVDVAKGTYTHVSHSITDKMRSADCGSPYVIQGVRPVPRLVLLRITPYSMFYNKYINVYS